MVNNEVYMLMQEGNTEFSLLLNQALLADRFLLFTSALYATTLTGLRVQLYENVE